MTRERIVVEEFKKRIISDGSGRVEIVEGGKTTKVLEEVAFPRVKEIKPKPKPEPASNYPAGALDSIFPLLQGVYLEENVEREEGFWLDRLDLKTLSDEDAFKALMEAKKTPNQIAEALLDLDPSFLTEKTFRPQSEGLAAIKSRVEAWINEEFKKTSS